MDIEKVATAIEADTGEALPDMRQALAEARDGMGRVTTPEQILVRQARKQSGLTQAAFAERIGTSRSRLSTYRHGRVTPSATLIHRMERVSAQANGHVGG